MSVNTRHRSLNTRREHGNFRRKTVLVSLSLLTLTGAMISVITARQPPVTESKRVAVSLKSPQPVTTVPAPAKTNAVRKAWHPPHKLKVWTTVHKGRTFRITQMPNCEHLDAFITYDPSGETLKKAKHRIGGIAACTGSFHHPGTMALADFLQRGGSIVSAPKTGRSFLAIYPGGKMDISNDYNSISRQPGVSALALGQRLLPLCKDGFSTAFMNRVTDRMAIALNDNFIFIIQGKSDIWRLAHFIDHKLPVDKAINSDGGHVVRGKAPVHIVFKWNNNGSNQTFVADSGGKAERNGGI